MQIGKECVEKILAWLGERGEGRGRRNVDSGDGFLLRLQDGYST